MTSQLPLELLHIAHYHQEHGVHPNPHASPRDIMRAELVTGGRGWVEHEDAWCEMLPGDLVWHGPGETTIGRSDFENPYRCLAVTFRVAPGTRRPVQRLSRWPELDEVRAFTRELIQRFHDDRFDRAALLWLAYGRLRYQAELSRHLRPDPAAPRAVRRALELIEHHYHEPLQLEDLADAAGCSVAHLHAHFREHVGESPHQTLIARRLRAAREQLTLTEDPLKQVSRACGFPDAAALCRRFRLAVGMTPGAYRKRHRDPATGIT